MTDNLVCFGGQNFKIESHGAAGDCLFNCLNSWLQNPGSQFLRDEIVKYICVNWEDYRIYISHVLQIDDQNIYAEMMSRSGEYDSLNELRAACSLYNIGVVVVWKRNDGSYFGIDLNILDAQKRFYMLFTGNENEENYLDGHFQILEAVELRKSHSFINTYRG